jgi:NADPH2:quinone reductase
VGLAALQIARGSVFRIIATAGTEEGMKLVKEEGADLVLCHRDPDYLEEMIKLNGGKKIDVILEMQAHLNLNKDLSILAKRGRVVVVGSRGTIEINPQYLKDAEIEIRSVSLLVASREDVEKIHLGLQKGFSNGHLIPIIDEEFSLEEAPKAHHKIIKMGQKGKIVLRIA